MTDTEDVRIERTFDAPIDLVWSMWTAAEHFSHWYGPSGARIPSAEMDVRVGGRRRLTIEMDTPNGPMRMHFAGEYRAVNPQTRLAYTEVIVDADGNPMTPEQMGMPSGSPTATLIEVDLEDLGARTGMTLRHVGVPANSPGAAGWEAAIGKMQAHVAELRR